MSNIYDSNTMELLASNVKAGELGMTVKALQNKGHMTYVQAVKKQK